MKKELIYSADIPEGVEVNIDGRILTVKGVNGENKRSFYYPNVELKKEHKEIILNCKIASKKEKAIMGVFIAHIKNMLKGVNRNFVYKLKICSGHFPMDIIVKGDKVIINNFLGEKKPRIAKILGNVKVNINGDVITLEGNNKEHVGQCSATIEKTTKVKGRDRRIFQDGIFIMEKDGRKVA